MLVKDLMSKDAVLIKEDETYEDAARKLVNNKVTGAPVVDNDGKLIGMVSITDLSKVLYPRYDTFSETPSSYTDFEDREKKVKEIRDNNIKQYMNKEIHTIDPDSPIMKAGGLMLAKKINRMPVVDDEGNLVGVIGRRRLFRFIFKENLNF